MKPPGATGPGLGAGLGQTSPPSNSKSTCNISDNAVTTSNNVLLMFTQPHMLSFFVIISTLLRLNVFKLEGQHPSQSNTAHTSQSNTTHLSQSNTTGTSAGSGTCSSIDVACIYVIRGMKRILSSLDPEVLPLRHIIRFKVTHLIILSPCVCDIHHTYNTLIHPCRLPVPRKRF